MSNERRTMFGVAIPTLLVALTVLTLTAFAALSLVSAGADLRMSRRLAQSTQRFISADAEAERHLQRIADTLKTADGEDVDETVFFERTAEVLPTLFTTPDSPHKLIACEVIGTRCRYLIYVDERHALEVTLSLFFRQETLYAVDGWQLVDTKEWQEHYQGFPVWTGE